MEEILYSAQFETKQVEDTVQKEADEKKSFEEDKDQYIMKYEFNAGNFWEDTLMLERFKQLADRKVLARTIHKESTKEKKTEAEVVQEEVDNSELRQRVKKASKHRFAKTRKSKMQTSADKMKKVQSKLASIKGNEYKLLLDDEKKDTDFIELFGLIRESDRYFAESYAKDKLEEEKIKAETDLVYYTRLVSYIDRQKSAIGALEASRGQELARRREELQKLVSNPELNARKIHETEAEISYLESEVKRIGGKSARYSTMDVEDIHEKMKVLTARIQEINAKQAT